MKQRRRKNKGAASFEVIDHPAGLAICVRAANWRELLRISAVAMFDLWTKHERSGSQEPTHMIPVELEAPNYETLLVDWLNELISLSQEQSMIFRNFEVLQLDFEATCRLTAMAEGERRQTSASQPIKAVASSDLRIEQTSRGLTTEIAFGV